MADSTERMLFRALWRVSSLDEQSRNSVYDSEMLEFFASYWDGMSEEERRDWVLPEGVRKWFDERR